MKTQTLYYQRNGSDKIYQANIEAEDNGYIVSFAYGRRGASLRTGRKTPAPVTLEEAEAIFAKLVKSKTAKGYMPGEGGAALTNDKTNGAYRGVACQLLNPVEHEQAMVLCDDDQYCAQAKHDGERRLLVRTNAVVRGVNKKGNYTSLNQTVAQTALTLPSQDYIIDSEDMGDHVVAFDLLRHDGADITHLPYRERLAKLNALVACVSQSAIRVTKTAFTAIDKRNMLALLDAYDQEGIVFKRANAKYTPGRPNSGGDQYKYKFYTECSVEVTAHNSGKRSVAVAVYEGDKAIPVGSVTIPPNKSVPPIGDIIEVRYLYAYPGGKLYQPVFLKARPDQDRTDCSIKQLKYKSQAIAA